MAGARSRFQKNKGGMVHQVRRRRRKIKTPPGHPTDAELISAFLEANSVTKCAPGYAMGSLASSCHGLDT